MLMTMTWCFVFSFVMQIGQEMSQNSFIQQYLAKQQELLRQRLEREAQQNEEANGNGHIRTVSTLKIKTPQLR